MDSPTPPQAPDPEVTARTQAQYNSQAANETANLNRPNQYTPFGNLTWTSTPGENGQTRWSSNLSLTPGVQSIVDSLTGAIGRSTSTPFDYSSAPNMPTMDTGARQRIEDAIYGRATSRLDPQFAQRDESLHSQLMNRGIPEGSQAWNDQIGNFERSRNDAYATARDDAVQRSVADMTQIFNNGLAARQQGVNEINMQHQLPINLFNALRNGSQSSFGSGGSGTVVQPGPYAQSAANNYQGQVNTYNSQVGANNSFMGGLFNMGAAALPFFL